MKKLDLLLKENGIGAADLFAALCAAFCISSLSFLAGGNFTDLTYVRSASILPAALIFVASAALIITLSLLLMTKRVIALSLLLFSAAFAVCLTAQLPENVFFCLGVGGILILCAKYALWDEDKTGLSKVSLTEKQAKIITLVMFFVYTATVFFFTALKYKSYSHGSYDFGIFAQMFEQMAKTGLPNTTVERAGEVSHFAVHFSPVFYILLPGYFLFRSPLYLLLAQAVVTGLGVFPMRKICKALGFGEKTSLLGAAAYLLYPTMANGTFYDFHENKLLTVLILWAVYFILRENKVGTLIFSIGILSVKEDAFIYVLALSLWIVFSRKEKLFGSLLATLSIIYFFFACSMIQLCGGEIMSSRFDNLSLNGGLLDAVKTCFLDVGYLIKEVFAGADTERFSELTYSGQKLEFVLWTVAPLMLLPLLHKKSTNLILLIPMLIINLVPSWLYQFNPDYQYTYGTVALLMFSAFLALSCMPRQIHRFAAVSVLMLCTVFTVSLALPKAQRYTAKYFNHIGDFQQTDAVLESIPKNASVTAYGFIMPHISYIDNLHSCPDYYGEYEKTDYYIIDTRYENDNHTAKMYAAMGDDYTLFAEGGYAKIYKLTGDTP